MRVLIPFRIYLDGHGPPSHIFIFIPVIFVLGLVLIPFGIFLAREHVKRLGREFSVDTDRRSYVRKFAIFFAITSALNVVIGTQGTNRAVEHMEKFSSAARVVT